MSWHEELPTTDRPRTNSMVETEQLLGVFATAAGMAHGTVDIAASEGNPDRALARMLGRGEGWLEKIVDGVRGNRPDKLPYTWADIRLIQAATLRAMLAELEGS